MTPTMLISSESTAEIPVSSISSVDVVGQIAQILGYDITAAMSEGYCLMAAESLSIAESTFVAGAEAWPT